MSQSIRDKARELLASGHVHETDSARPDVRRFKVKDYTVLIGPDTAVDCTCPAGRVRQGCSHLRAAMEFIWDEIAEKSA